MLLDELVGVIQTIQDRIRDHGASLRENETRTRMALIDPLLQALGWDIADPGLVTPEYNVSGRKADYALLKPDGHPAATVEAKKLGESLESHRMQMLNYSNASGVEYAGLTDGNRWELYEVFQRGQLEDRRTLDITLAGNPAHQLALRLLLLWRPNLASGQPIAASEPVFFESMRATTTTESDSNSEQATHPPTSPDEAWVSLNGFQPGVGRPAPSAIRLPSGADRKVSSWVEIPAIVAEWLIQTGKLTPDKFPLGLPLTNRQTRYFINKEPRHSNGNEFRSRRQLSNGLSIETNFSADASTNNAKFLLTHFNEDPAAVWLKLN